jgi:hypothetical protein
MQYGHPKENLSPIRYLCDFNTQLLCFYIMTTVCYLLDFILWNAIADIIVFYGQQRNASDCPYYIHVYAIWTRGGHITLMVKKSCT